MIAVFDLRPTGSARPRSLRSASLIRKASAVSNADLTRAELSAAAHASVLASADLLSGLVHADRPSGKTRVAKRPSGRPCLDCPGVESRQSRSSDTHISLSHVRSAVAGLAATD